MRPALAPPVILAVVLAVVLALGALTAPPAATAAEGPLLIAGPDEPGPDLPSAGRSLFDALFETTPAAAQRSAARHDLPYPFERLLAAVEQRVAPARARSVLIPLGRSLQRFAADPDYFASPRLVVAVDSESGDCEADCPRLKDRLFMGYQAAAGVIEVISYNEAAGRFEFQVVEDYGPGGEPSVRYAERAVCTACHQGHAPIFSDARWRESNGNPRVAARLRAQAAEFHGVPAGQGIDGPDAFDQATDRASRLGFANFVWRSGCGERSSARAVACRGALLRAALRFRLGGARGLRPDPGTAPGKDARALHEALRVAAPGGLGVPSPGLPDRDPLAAVEAGAEPYDAIEPEGVFDPTQPRAALMFWRPADPPAQAFATAARDVAAFFPPRDIARLSAALDARETAAPAARRFRGDCTARRIGIGGGRSELRLDCAGDELALSGHVSLESGHATGGRLRALRPAGFPAVQRLEIAGATQAAGGKKLVLTLREAAQGLAPRLPGGERLTELTLRLSVNDKAQAEVGVVDDVAALDAVIGKLVADLAPPLDAGPIRPDLILAALMAGLAGR